MNLVMSYIDYNMAALEDREVFSCTKTETAEIYEKLKENQQIEGSVLIATCNRTELYLNISDDADINPFEILCSCIGVEYNNYAHMSITLKGDDVLDHLCKVASGAESQIWGEDQIISQVRDSIKTARAYKASDTILNVVFRTGVSAGKKVKTLVDFKVHDNSTAAKAVNLIVRKPEIKNVLVIGNGMIGRLVAELLEKAGKKVTMTLRQYKHGENIVPDGVGTVLYGDRYKVIEESDAVISATLSPHFTVTCENIKKLSKVPSVFIDMAVPRDIDPETAQLENVTYYDIDHISREDRTVKQEEQLKQIDEIILKYKDDFYKWYDFRENMLKEKAEKEN